VGQDDGKVWTTATNVSVVLQGTIHADVAGEQIYLDGASCINSGTLESRNGGGLNVYSSNVQQNAGTIDAGTGSNVQFHGALSGASSGTITIEIGGPSPSQYGLVIFDGAANLGGTLNIVLVGGFVPSSGQTFQVMTWSSESGTLSTINNPMSATFTVSYDPHDLTLKAG
jgi:hypothetical protein